MEGGRAGRRRPGRGSGGGGRACGPAPVRGPFPPAGWGGGPAGAFLGEHWGVAALALTGLFVLAVTRLLRAFRGGS
ncbi:mercury resistance protein [Escherichia coli]|uniref:mercury resistance protein n=1 Tax=Escherichia coli TaxID=562 RepID=UPI003855F415